MTNRSSEVREAVLRAGVYTEGHFIFADGNHATNKLEMDNLWKHKEELNFVLSRLADADGCSEPDVFMGVPRGGQLFAQELKRRRLLLKPLVMLERVPGGTKQDFRFLTPEDEALARSAKTIRIYEDVVTTLSSIAGVVRLLDPARQNIESVAIWNRKEIKEKYRAGVKDFYLTEESMPSYSPEECPVCITAVRP